MILTGQKSSQVQVQALGFLPLMGRRPAWLPTPDALCSCWHPLRLMEGQVVSGGRGVLKESGFCSFDGQDQVCACLPCSEVKVLGKVVVLMEGLTGLSKMAGEEKSA